MSWTSTEHGAWEEKCREFAAERVAFRLDHVFGEKEEQICDSLCAEYNFRQKTCGSSILFTPIPN